MLNPDQQRLLQEALALHQAAKLDEAARIYSDLLAAAPDHADLLQLLGVLHFQRRNHADAIASMRKSLALVPNQPRVHLNLGNALSASGRMEEACASLAHAIALKPDFADAHYNHANVLHRMGRLDEALAGFQRAIALKPDFADAFLNQGNVLKDFRRFDDAAASYRQALGCNPRSTKAYINLGLVLEELGRPDDAVAHYRQAAAIDPSSGDAYANLGSLLRNQRRYRGALDAYREALRLNPNLPFIQGYYLHTKQHACDWKGMDAEITEILARLTRGEPAATPFTLLATRVPPALLRKSAELYAEGHFPASAAPTGTGSHAADGKIRIGYFSADFYNHATSHLLVEMLERHDRTRFEITGFSWGVAESGGVGTRIAAAFDRFIDVHAKSDAAVAQLARSLGIEIAVDLKGFTSDGRTGIFAPRCAPVQVSFLGFPGTMGVNYIDYLIADPVLIPPEQRPHYAEHIVYLPDTYQPNDSQRRVASDVPSRNAHGLPDTGIVFCSFNANFKITPAVFDIWMRLLRAVPDSVLWLLGGSPEAAENLRREATARSVASERLVFAPRVPLGEHLARHVHADVFLDTFFCNGHTTTSDALRGGVPVVTWIGETFAGRVSASLLRAAGLPELVTTTWADYEALALALATDSDRRLALRAKLAVGRTTCALFDTARFTRHIEAAYQRMSARARAGLDPADMVIDPV